MTINVDPSGPLHTQSRLERFWSTTNVGEALPGVATPLGWSLWGPAVDVGVRDCFARMGALASGDVRVQDDPNDAVAAVFYGRAALNVNFFCEMGGLLPGSGPDAIARQLLGEVPAGIPLARSRRRLPFVAVRMPYALATIRRDVIARTGPTKAWWQAWVPRFDTLDEAGARHALAEGRDRFTEMIRVQAGGVFIGVQAVYDQLLTLIEKAGLDHAQANALVAGQGSHAETDIIFDLWRMGRGELDLDAFLTEHGYHGPREGEVSGRVWREDPTPVLRLAAQYGERDDAQDPALAAAERTRARERAERELLAGLPAAQRPGAKLVLKLAVSRIPLRGVAKAAYLQALDVARGAARRLGTLLATDGRLDDPEDVFLFEVSELVDGLPAGAKEIAARRRAQRADFLRHDIPTHWQGRPAPFELAPADDTSGASDAQDAQATVSGIGASGGIAEGFVRVVHDPTFNDIEPDEVLVCVTTDPSWASVLFLSSALVVDIGGLLSHAAVVAREVGVPCVIGTGNGTRVLRTGDRVRVDGNKGTVEILRRAAEGADRDGVTRGSTKSDSTKSDSVIRDSELESTA
ncbi:PEP-utilizing enzyme [Protofrankia coriariae]|uniref:PEP-utilizing protein mobile subunit n=1 Tax=Protofrankia coriariae TaxID=1562887 RepID=A0ABR5F2E8_9ACTN|nr:PEP-utilizing enzyme [Protofrankia coriariae]KLL10899.1 PEP-utilizing protein mobile subunit [Protofrankia coriariae]